MPNWENITPPYQEDEEAAVNRVLASLGGPEILKQRAKENLEEVRREGGGNKDDIIRKVAQRTITAGDMRRLYESPNDDYRIYKQWIARTLHQIEKDKQAESEKLIRDAERLQTDEENRTGTHPEELNTK